MIVRLNKYLSECGIASRRKSDELITSGRVLLNGSEVHELGVKIDPDIDVVSIDGEILKKRSKIYYILNKPKGVITSTTDDRHRKTVVDLINSREKIFPVGRLDFNTTGLLFLTNDGEFSNSLTHPKNGIEREYEVIIDKPLSKEDRIKLLKGVFIDKKRSVFTQISYPKRNKYTLLHVVTVEGRNHFVKKMFDTIGYRVQELKRIRYGKMTVNNMKVGEFRILSQKEVNNILK